MKKTFCLVLTTFLFAVTIMFFSACEGKELVYTDADIVSLSLESTFTEVRLGTGEAAVFTVTGYAGDGTAIPCSAELYCNGTPLNKSYLETAIPGTYEITAKLGAVESAPLQITVLPDEITSIRLNFTRSTFYQGAQLKLTPEVYAANDILVTQTPDYYIDGEPVDLDSYRADALGLHTLTAELNDTTSAPYVFSVVSSMSRTMTLEVSAPSPAPGESVSFSYSVMPRYTGDPANVKLIHAQTGAVIEGDTFTPQTPGIYSFYLQIEDHVSNTVSITVPAPAADTVLDFSAFPGYASTLPVIILDTGGAEITAETSEATLYVYDKGVNNPGDAPDFISSIDIKQRGQSSMDFPKKQYAIHLKNEDGTNNNAALLGLPPENDWVLNGSYADKSLIKNSLMYDLMGKVTDYSARTEFCEVYLTRPDGTLDYIGIYTLIEKIKIDKNRVNIHKMTEEDENITGGYIVAIDKIVADEVVVETSLWDMTVVSPNREDLTDAQYDYISQYLKEFSLALEGENRADPETGYRKYFDPESIVGQLLLDEWIRNIDCMRFSAYMYKDQDDVLRFGPPWDFDITCGRCDYGDGWIVAGWEMGSMNDLCMHLMMDPSFVQLFVDTWKEYRSTFLTDEKIVNYIDNKVAALGEAPLARSLARWYHQWDGETYVWPNPVDGLYSDTHAEEIKLIKSFLLARAKWMDKNIDDLLVGDIKEKIW